MENKAAASVSRTAGWWRWSLVPVSAVVGLVAVWIVASVVLWLQVRFTGGFAADGWYALYVVPAVASAVAGWAFAAGACTTAPRGQKLAGAVMVALLGVVGVAGAVIAWSQPEHGVGQATQVTVAAVVAFAAAVVRVVAFEPLSAPRPSRTR